MTTLNQNAHMIVSAFRADETLETNQRRQKYLLKRLNELGLQVAAVGTGSFQEDGQAAPSIEESIAVFGSCQQLVNALRPLMFEEFNQDAVLYVIGDLFGPVNYALLMWSNGDSAWLGSFAKVDKVIAHQYDAYSEFNGDFYVCRDTGRTLMDAIHRNIEIHSVAA